MSKQWVLKPQDVLVALKIAVQPDRQFTYAELAGELRMSASEVHAATKRAELSKLLSRTETVLTPVRHSLQEFLVHGVKYAFPATRGALTRGVPTAVAGPVLARFFEQGDELVPVWPDAEGTVRGIALYPIYPSVPGACRIDERLYEVVTLVDAIRAGTARERELASRALLERLS